MTNDEAWSRHASLSRLGACRSEHLRPLRLFGHSSFGFLSSFVIRHSSFLLFCLAVHGSDLDTLFHQGTSSYQAREYIRAAESFRQSVALKPASGAYQNLGLAEWQRGRAGEAILAWERALWLDPFNSACHGNLRFARQSAQLEPPNLTWYEVVSTWLPINWWAWLAGLGLWLAIGMTIVPGCLRMRKAGWHQALAALGLTIFLLSLPAHLGVLARSRLGFILQKDIPLRLTPTSEGQPITRLAAGEPVRWLRQRDRFLLVRSNHATGWVERVQFAGVCSGISEK